MLLVAPRRGAWIEISLYISAKVSSLVAPRRGAWIEIWMSWPDADAMKVAPRRGAWIEIGLLLRPASQPPSHPAGVRG